MPFRQSTTSNPAVATGRAAAPSRAGHAAASRHRDRRRDSICRYFTCRSRNSRISVTSRVHRTDTFAVLGFEQMAIILHRRAAARRIHNHRHRHLCTRAHEADILSRQRPAFFLTAHMQWQRAAAARTLRDHDLAAMPCQHPNGGSINLAIERLLRATRQQKYTQSPRARCRKRRGDTNSVRASRCASCTRLAAASATSFQKAARASQISSPRKAPRIGQGLCQHQPQHRSPSGR